ncbi:MAG: radical SAM protein [Burkholderiaceae bacterium]|nr:radical SAM protein [Burkholderiaceae bacterium]
MRLPFSPFNAHAQGVAVPIADGRGAMDLALPGLRFGGALRHGVAQPIAVALPPEPEGYRLALEALAQRPEEAISLDFALPFCAAHCLCCDRDILAAQPEEVIDDYVDGLIEETRTLAGRIGTQRDVLQLHLGGGSASELEDVQLVRLVQAVRDAWRLPADAEMSIDCDPRRVGWMQMQLLRSLGFTRVKFGVLDLDPKVQQAIGRRHSVALIDDVCEVARSCGMEYVNLELMVGLPHQVTASWRDTLRRLVAMAPDRITLACYRHRPQQAPGQYAIDSDALPDEDECRALAALTAEFLREAGYCWIGADQFVLETDELALAQSQGQLRRSRISYTTTPSSALLAQGVAAASEIDGHLFTNTASMPAWRQAVRAGRSAVARAQLPTPWQAQARQAQQQLLCNLELPQSMVGDALQPAYARLARHAQGGLVHVLEDRIVVTDRGRLALPMLCAELDELPLQPADRGSAPP